VNPEAQCHRPVLAAGQGSSGGRVAGTAAAIDPGQGPKLFDVAVGDRDGDALQIGSAPDPDRAAATGTAGGRHCCGGNPLDGSLEHQRERAAFFADRDAAAGMPDLLDRERGHPVAILRQDVDSHSRDATEGRAGRTVPATPAAALTGFLRRARGRMVRSDDGSTLGENEGGMANESAAALVRGSPPAAGEGLTAGAFRGLEMTFKDARAQNSADVEAAAVVQRRQLVKALIDQHIDDPKWQEILHQARQSAERGDKEYLLLRFPSELCTDDARAINNPPNPDWPKTLQGEAGELYARWRDQLSPRGFHLAARVLDLPGGKPGDVGLFLFWGE
jgi:hypothetical protein